MIDHEMIRIVRRQFALEWNGIHGVPHWTRVRQTGLRLAQSTGANMKVVELFAFLHDSRRLNDGCDPDHGPRAALFEESLAGKAFDLEPHELELLTAACRGHSEGLTVGESTVITCWDADRLDLGRVGKRPDPARLCTAAARDPDLLEWAYKRSMR